MDSGCCTECGGALTPVITHEGNREVVDYICEGCGRIDSLAPLETEPWSSLIEESA